MSKKTLNAFKYILMAVLGVVAFYAAHQGSHALVAYLTDKHLEITKFNGLIPCISRDLSEKGVYYTGMAAILFPFLISLLSSIRQKSRDAQKTHATFWLFYTIPMFALSVANLVAYFVVDEPAKRAMWDIVNSMDHPVAPFLISRGIDINHSVGFSLIGIVILCSMTVIGNMIRRFKNKG